MDKPPPSDVYIHHDGFAARLRQSIAAYGSPAGLAKAIGRSEGAVRKWMRGDSEPNVSDLRAICTETRTGVEWLVTGRGQRESSLEVREDLLPYSSGASPIDHSFLESIINAVDEELLANGAEIASTKRSAVIVTLYQLAHGSREIDEAAVRRIVKLAA